MNESITAVLPLASFAFAMSITPGPNNFMLLASGASFGLARTLPHLFGVTAGFAALLLAAWSGVAAVLLQWPQLAIGLTLLCALYLLWLAAMLLRSGSPRREHFSGRPARPPVPALPPLVALLAVVTAVWMIAGVVDSPGGLLRELPWAAHTPAGRAGWFVDGARRGV